MAYGYQPRDPRGKLREIVTKYVSSMRVAGHAPNRGVLFGEDGAADTPPDSRGWLVDARRPGAAGERYLLLENGDVWRAPQSESPTPALDAAVSAWLAEPSDDLVTLLARSLSDARMGGRGWLDEGDGVERVQDRRQVRDPHQGPERRHND